MAIQFGDADHECQTTSPDVTSRGEVWRGGDKITYKKRIVFHRVLASLMASPPSGSVRNSMPVGRHALPWKLHLKKPMGFYRGLKDLHAVGVAEPWRSLNNKHSGYRLESIRP